MSERHTGDVTLPDGRIVHGSVDSVYDGGWGGTGGGDILSVYIEWPSGEELTEEEYNEDLGDCYLHEYVTERLLLVPGEPLADDWL